MRLSVCLWRRAIFPFKQINKVIRILITDHKGDLMNLLIGGKEQAGGGLQPLPVEIFEGRHPENGGKLVADPVFAHMIALFQLIQPERFHKGSIQVPFQFHQIRSAYLLIPFQAVCVDEES